MKKFEMHDNTHELKVLMLDGATGFYRRFRLYRIQPADIRGYPSPLLARFLCVVHGRRTGISMSDLSFPWVGTLAWLMDCLDDGLIKPRELGVDRAPRWEPANFDVVEDSMHYGRDFLCDENFFQKCGYPAHDRNNHHVLPQQIKELT